MNFPLRIVYEFGRVMTAFNPPARWRWEKEWKRRFPDLTDSW